MSLRDYLFHEEPGITLYRGDCREVLPLLDYREIQPVVIVTDPPYGMASYATDRRVLDGALLSRWLLLAVTVAVFGYPEELTRLCVEANTPVNEWVTWWPTNKWGGRGETLPRNSEHIAIFGETPGAATLMRPRSLNRHGALRAQESGLAVTEAREGDVWRDPSPGCQFNWHLRLHPNEKPVGVISKLVQMCATDRHTVVDPFAGSGTTLLVAKSLRRRAIGIEIEPKYCEIAVKRLRQEVLPL